MKIPSNAELLELRKGLRKQKVPEILDGFWCSEPGIGGAKFSKSGADYEVVWVSFENGVKSEQKKASWRNLCLQASMELERYELGSVISEIFEAHAVKAMESIGHPIEAANVAKPYWDTATRWKHWGVVAAGHMLGIS